MSENEKVTILDVIDCADSLLKDLRRQVAAAGDNEALAASFVLEEDGSGDILSRAVTRLKDKAKGTASDTWEDLHAFLSNHSTWPEMMFWTRFHKKLDALGETSVQFRESCLHRSFEESGCNLFHEVCKLNPPVNVVKKMIEVTPEEGVDKIWPSHYNHLSSARGSNGEYPLHMVMKYGGSLELVQYLVDEDTEGKSLSRSSYSGRSHSVIHVLVANKGSHSPDLFSKILRYTVLSMKSERSPLVHEDKANKKAPVAILWDSLKQEGLSESDILQNDDFAFLLKATCYHHTIEIGSSGMYKCVKTIVEPTDRDKKVQEIQAISMGRAFLVCFPCFSMKVATSVLKTLCSIDNTFLLQPEPNTTTVQYPIHRILLGWPSFYIDKLENGNMGMSSDRFDTFMIETILGLVPQCAQQVNGEGLLPLQIVSDTQKMSHLDGYLRFSLVKTIWKAYPEAASIMNKRANLPLFALPVRGSDAKSSNYYDSDDGGNEVYSLSATFFLLRKQPEMLSEAIASGSVKDKPEAEMERPAKRSRT